MKMFSKITKVLSAGVLAVAASTAFAAPINIGGVIWDPDQVGLAPDFSANGSLFETVTSGAGSIVSGRGKFERINSVVNNEPSFCPGCELTFQFSMTTQSITPTGANSADFVFSNLVLNLYVDHTPDYDGTVASAGSEGGANPLFLQLTLNGLLVGSGQNIGTGSDLGNGQGLLDVTGGLAAANFDTNTQVNGADFAFTSSFQPILGVDGLLSGTWDMTGDSIPSPAPLALIGLGLLGMGLARRRMAK